MCTLIVVSTKQSQRLQTGLCVRNRNAITMSKWKGFYHSDRKDRSEYERLSCRKLPKNQHANCGTILPKVCNFINHEKSGKIRSSVQCQERFNLKFKEKNCWFRCFLWQRNGNAANKVWHFVFGQNRMFVLCV